MNYFHNTIKYTVEWSNKDDVKTLYERLTLVEGKTRKPVKQ